MRSWEEVHRLHDQGKSGRAIARILGISRNTVSRLLAMSQPPTHGRTGRSKLDPYRAAVISLLREDPNMSATAIHRHLVNLGYDGGLSIVREFAARIRRQAEQSAATGHAPHVPMPVGEPAISARSSDSGVDLYESPVEPASEPGINLISVDFDIMMVNRVNERLFQKPMVGLLGKKCYQEFERRDDVCPHCPGLAALVTGRPHQVETRGIRDDGTKYAVRLTAHPIMAPNGDPVGFVEVEEDITERKRSERLAELVEYLQTSLAAIHDLAGAVRHALNVAFSLEGVDYGRAYVWDGAAGQYRAIAQRGASGDLALAGAVQGILRPNRPGSDQTSPQDGGSVRVIRRGRAALASVPILHGGAMVGILLLGSSTYSEFPPATHAAFEALGKIVGSAVANIQAVELQRETRADMERLLGFLPLPAWCTDDRGKVTLWNRAAERVFGWSAAETCGAELPLEFRSAASPDWLDCRAKDGTPLRLRLASSPSPRALGTERSILTVAFDISAAPLPLSADAGARLPCSANFKPQAQSLRVLLTEQDAAQRRRLARMLRTTGCQVETCKDGEIAASCYQAAMRSDRPYDLVIAELVPSAGLAGLELAGILRRLDPRARVVLTADSNIVGFESYGLAGALRRPYEPAAVARIVSQLRGSRVDAGTPRPDGNGPQRQTRRPPASQEAGGRSR